MVSILTFSSRKAKTEEDREGKEKVVVLGSGFGALGFVGTHSIFGYKSYHLPEHPHPHTFTRTNTSIDTLSSPPPDIHLGSLDPNLYEVHVVSPRGHFLYTPLLSESIVGGVQIERYISDRQTHASTRADGQYCGADSLV